MRLRSFGLSRNKTAKIKEHLPKWKKVEPAFTSSPVSEEKRKIEEIINEIGGKTPYEIFSLYFDSEVLSQIVAFSNKYAQDNNRHAFHLTDTDLKKFIGIMILSGYHTLPSMKLYWSKDEDKGLPVVRKCMSRNKFMAIKQTIHLSDNSQLDVKD